MNKKLILSLVLTVGLAFSIKAQDTAPVKIGYVNVEYIMEKWDDIKNAQEDMQIYQKQLEKKVDALKKEAEQKYAILNDPNTAALEANKAKLDLQALSGKIQLEENQAILDFQKRYNTKVQPLLDTVLAKIQYVGKKNGYTYVFNQQAAAAQTIIVLYAEDQHNLSKAVLKELGVAVTDEGQ